MLRLFNTRSEKVEEFRPQRPDLVRIYSCGPTVYNTAHIGNLSSYIFADLLRRAVKLAGFKTQHAMNFTNVDDKTIARSQAKFPELDAHTALKKLTRHYETIFLDEVAAVGVDVAKIDFLRATDHIDEIQNLIKKLLREKIAYVADDAIYFSISEYQKTRKYGQLSEIEPSENRRARICDDEYDKEAAEDFALWKKQKPGEPAWNFLLENRATGKEENFAGRPGWHIECSAMSVAHLGQPFDIHTGGEDLIFPHHENEIAQSTAGDQPAKMAEFFVHNAHLLVDGKKMSKSAHNFYTLKDLCKQGFSPLDFRMLVLQSHYQKATNFSWENLAAAQARRNNWREIAALRHQISQDSQAQNSEKFARAQSHLEKAHEEFLNNINTPEVLKNIDAAFAEIANPADFNSEILTKILDFVDRYLGLKIRETSPDISDSQKNLIETRNIARDEKDFAKSDQIRDELFAQHIKLRDEKDQTFWSWVK